MLSRSADGLVGCTASGPLARNVLRLSLSHKKKPMTDWKEMITANPEVMVGKPVIAGTRLTVDSSSNVSADGWSEDELLQNYPKLTREQIPNACLAYAAEMLSEVQMYSLPLSRHA